mmetsp:Transcript_31442/g.31121  ORF Transcript_31442/g.31121 Transcript_31442/m.31121 type:complete len:312 (-) Transcript_31442:246-1181(-)
MNFQTILAEWLCHLSQDSPIELEKCQNSIKITCQNLLNEEISSNIKELCNKILYIVNQTLADEVSKLYLINYIAGILDFYFINSFPDMVTQFEEFLKESLNSTAKQNQKQIEIAPIKSFKFHRISQDYLSNSSNEKCSGIREINLDQNSFFTIIRLTPSYNRANENLKDIYSFKFDNEWPIRVGKEISGFNVHIPMSSCSQIVFEKLKNHVFVHETATNSPELKIRVQQSVLTVGQIYMFGRTKMKVRDIDYIGNVQLEFESDNEATRNEEIDALEKKPRTIGRSRGNSFRFPCDFKMSKKHAEIYKEGKM